MLNQDVTILLVEDDDVDVKAIKRAFAKRGVINPLVEARNGLEALDLLRGGPGRQRVCLPYLVVLDLNMPRMNGLEFLAELRADDDLRSAIVFVLTTSRAEEDVVEAYRLNVAGYMAKSNPASALLEKASMINQYLQVVEFAGATDG